MKAIFIVLLLAVSLRLSAEGFGTQALVGAVAAKKNVGPLLRIAVGVAIALGMVIYWTSKHPSDYAHTAH